MKRLSLSLLLISFITFIYAQLPQVYLNGSFGYDYSQGEIYIVDSDTIRLTANIKWRGGSTNSDGKHKRNYKIKLSEDVSLLGLRQDNNWILDAGQADPFRLRNRIATDLWNDFAEKPYYSHTAPAVLSGARGRVVEVYLNNDYVGIYCLTEVIDRKQLKLKKFDNAINGQLWKSEGYGCALMWDVPPYDNHSPTWDVFQAIYPDLNDLDTTDYTTLYDAIHFVVNSTDSEFARHVHQYFDIPVLVDYYIFLLTMNAFDNVGKNIYWATFDKNEDKRLTLAVWDLDATAGQRWTEKFLPGSSSPDYDINVNMRLYVRLTQLNAVDFNTKVSRRYFQLRRTWLSTDSLINRYQSYYHLITTAGAAQREQLRWSGDTDIDEQILDFHSELDYITHWITSHMAYLDKNLSTLSNPISPVFSHPTRRYYNLFGQPFISQPSRRGVYIINGRKHIIAR